MFQYIINAMYTKILLILHYQPFNTCISRVLPLQQNLQWNILLLEILQMPWDFKQNWFTSTKQEQKIIQKRKVLNWPNHSEQKHSTISNKKFIAEC